MNSKFSIALAFDDSLDRVDGVQQQLKLLGGWLGRNGHEVSYLVGQTDARRLNNQRVHSLSRNFSISANQNRLSLPRPVPRDKIEAVFDREKFDVVHIMLPFSPFLGRQIVRTALDRNIPIIGTFHTYPASKSQVIGSWLYGRWLKRYLRRFRAITSVSEATKDYVARTFSVDSLVIPNFIDVTEFVSGKSLPRMVQGKRTVLYLSRLVKRKGPQHLLEAIGELEAQTRFGLSQLVLCGSGPMAKRLRTMAIELKLSNKVLMTGFIDEKDKADYLASADLAVFPATGGEAFGIVLIEAMASGALVLGGDNPGYRSVLKDQPELLVNAADHRALAERIDKLLTDNGLRRKLLAWQETQIGKYDVASVGPEILDLYLGKTT